MSGLRFGSYQIAYLAVGAFVLWTARAFASSPAADNAGSSAYDTGWGAAATTTNFGTWGSAWTFTQTNLNGSQNGRFVGTSAQNDNGASGLVNINTSSRAWAMYANSGTSVTATRQFNGAMTAGQAFRVDMDNGGIDNNSPAADESRNRVGFKLLDSSANTVFEFRFRGGDATYTYKRSASDTPISAGPGFTRGGLRIEFALVDSSGNASSTNFRLRVWQPNNASSPTEIFSSLLQAGTTIDRVQLFNNNAGGGDQANAYFNSISIPEPTTFAALAGLLCATTLRRARRSR